MHTNQSGLTPSRRHPKGEGSVVNEFAFIRTTIYENLRELRRFLTTDFTDRHGWKRSCHLCSYPRNPCHPWLWLVAACRAVFIRGLETLPDLRPDPNQAIESKPETSYDKRCAYSIGTNR